MRSPARPLASILAVLFLLVVRPPAPAAAADEDDFATAGSLRVVEPNGTIVDLPLAHTKASIEVTAFVARTTIEQVFTNPFAQPVEAVYTFPLGHGAAVDDFELVVGDRTIRGEIKRRAEARAAYEQARAAGYQAALLEQERPNVFTQSVANLEPGKTITVRLRTVETLRYERGTYRLTFPLVVGPRYVPGGGRVPDAARISPPVLAPGTRSGHDVEIAVTIDAGVPIASLESPSHRTIVTKSARTAAVRLAEGDTIPNKDFLLRWSVASERPALGLLAHRDGLDGFFTLLVQPKGEIGASEAMPKEITFVLDTSGSMSGVPIEASKRLVAKALRALGPRDTFNLIRFAGDNEIYKKQALPNDRASVEAALSWIERQSGAGGTELLPAMVAAFRPAPDPNRLRVVVFLTDGYVGNEPEILAEIGKVLGDARLYTIGIGSSVNHHLLDAMADLGRGAYVFVRPDESADDALEAFRSWVTRPYLTDLTIDWGALPVADVTPEKLPDLGSGQTLTVVGRYLEAGEGKVVVRGKIGGRYFEQTLDVALPERENDNQALSSLWARARIGALMRDPGATAFDAVQAEITELALAYRLMSPYTSFVAIDSARVVNAGGNTPTVHQSLPMPEGVSHEGVFGVREEIDAIAGGVPGGMPGGVAGGVKTQFSSEFIADLKVAGETAMVNLDDNATKTHFSSGFMADLPVAGRMYQHTTSVSGVSSPQAVPPPAPLEVKKDKEKSKGNAASPASARSDLSKPGPPTEPGELLLDAAFRVLADLADDGKLSRAEGKPALAALLAAQRDSGAVAEPVMVHAVATWALAAASSASPAEGKLAEAKESAVNYLVGLAQPTGWPARPGEGVDAESTRWARLVLRSLAPDVVNSTPVPAGTGGSRYVQLRASLAAARAAVPASPGLSAFDRLLRSIPRGHLKL